MKKLGIVFLSALMICNFCACDNDSGPSDESGNNTPIVGMINFTSLSGYTTALYDYREAGMTDVNNNPLVIAYYEETLEYVKDTNNGKTYDVYRYTSIERTTEADGKNGDEALKQVDLYKTVYTIVQTGDTLYYEVEETDLQILEEMDTIYPGITHEMSLATVSEKTEVEELINKLLPNNNTVEKLKTKDGANALVKSGTEKIGDFTGEVYKTSDQKWAAVTDSNGILLYGKSLAKTALGTPVGQEYNPYLYVFSFTIATIDIDYTAIV